MQESTQCVVPVRVGLGVCALEASTVQPAKQEHASLEMSSQWKQTSDGLLIADLGRLLGVDGPVGQTLALIEATPAPFGLLVHAESVEPRGVSDLYPLPAGTDRASGPYIGAIPSKGRFLPLLSGQQLAPEGYRVPNLLLPKWPDPRDGATPVASSSEQGGPGQILIFSAAAGRLDPEVSFGISVKQILEITPFEGVQQVPNTTRGVLGVASWRGLPLLVVDLVSTLGLAPRNPDASRILVVRNTAGDHLLGVTVDPHAGVVNLPVQNELWKKALPLSRELILGAYDIDGDLLLIPNIDHVVTSRNLWVQVN